MPNITEMRNFIDRFADYPLPPLFGVFVCVMLWRGAEWYMSIPAPSAEQTGYIGGLVLAVMGFMKYYCEMLKNTAT